jgi:MOSC domain-containing protein YiiM
MFQPKVLSVNKSPAHTIIKKPCSMAQVIKNFGIENDAHAGKTVKHRYDAAKTPNKPNLRQVHLIQFELYQELNEKGFMVSPGELGENITTKNIDLFNLPKGTLLQIGDDCLLQITGLRAPCGQLNKVHKGLKQAVMVTNNNGEDVLNKGIFAIVLKNGTITQNDAISVEVPKKPFIALHKV